MIKFLPPLTLAGIFSVASLLPAAAGEFQPVELEPMTHASASLQVIGRDGVSVSYSPAQLEALGAYRLTTSTPWRDEPATFEGVRLRDILAASGMAEGVSIMVTAENDFSTVLTADLLETVDVLVATRVDGRAHNRRERGPIQFVIDQEAFAASDLTDEANFVWMAARIEPAS